PPVASRYAASVARRISIRSNLRSRPTKSWRGATSVTSKAEDKAHRHRGSARRPSRHDIQCVVVCRRWEVHEKGLISRGDLDAAFLEASLHATIEFALYWPATAVAATD